MAAAVRARQQPAPVRDGDADDDDGGDDDPPGDDPPGDDPPGDDPPADDEDLAPPPVRWQAAVNAQLADPLQALFALLADDHPPAAGVGQFAKPSDVPDAFVVREINYRHFRGTVGMWRAQLERRLQERIAHREAGTPIPAPSFNDLTAVVMAMLDAVLAAGMQHLDQPAPDSRKAAFALIRLHAELHHLHEQFRYTAQEILHLLGLGCCSLHEFAQWRTAAIAEFRRLHSRSGNARALGPARGGGGADAPARRPRARRQQRAQGAAQQPNPQRPAAQQQQQGAAQQRPAQQRPAPQPAAPGQHRRN